jgi:hypothetical protein
MRKLSAILLAVALSACAGTPGPRQAPLPQEVRPVVGLDVTNVMGWSIDVYANGRFMGTLAPNQHEIYAIAPSIEKPYVSARWALGAPIDETMTIGTSRMVRYIYGDPEPTGHDVLSGQ